LAGKTYYQKRKVSAPTQPEKQIAFKKGVAKLADTVYHEFRHCERWFRMARFLVTKKEPADRISALMSIELKTAAEAAKLPPLAGEELKEGEAWYEAVYGRPEAPKTGVATATAASLRAPSKQTEASGTGGS
jgi:hypothetical protein